MKYLIEIKHVPVFRDWTLACDPPSDLETMRQLVAENILSRLDYEDRGDEFENEWRSLAEAALKAEPYEILEFDERAWRIVEAQEEDD